MIHSGEKSLKHDLDQYVAHYSAERPHQGIEAAHQSVHAPVPIRIRQIIRDPVAICVRGPKDLRKSCRSPIYGFTIDRPQLSPHSLWQQSWAVAPITEVIPRALSWAFDAGRQMESWMQTRRAPNNKLSPFPFMCSKLHIYRA